MRCQEFRTPLRLSDTGGTNPKEFPNSGHRYLKWEQKSSKRVNAFDF